MVLCASDHRRNGHTILHGVEAVAAPGERQQGPSYTPFPRWRSRFARSSGFLPERDGRYAPPLPDPVEPAPSQDAIRDPAAAGAA